MGVLVPETLTAAPGPVHPIPAHHPPDIARANRPVWGSISGIPQGSCVAAVRVTPSQRVSGWCGYCRYPPNTCKTGFEAEPSRRQERFCPPSCWYRVVWFVLLGGVLGALLVPQGRGCVVGVDADGRVGGGGSVCGSGHCWWWCGGFGRVF